MPRPHSWKAIAVVPVVLVALNTGDAFVNTSSTISVNDGTVTSVVETHIESSGGSQATAEVENHVESSAANQVTKSIQVTVNGETKKIESTQPGTDRLEIRITSVPSGPPATPSAAATITPAPAPDAQGIIKNVRKFLDELFDSLFS